MSRQLVSIINKVNSADITRSTNGRGDEIIIVPSKTLPDDIVMNNGLYPEAEIAKGFQSLEGKLSPIGHPYDENGNYISANDAEAINYFHGGAVTRNVKRVAEEPYGHRVHSEIHINVKVAQQSEQGRRLLAAINAGKPISTSTGVLLHSIPGKGVNSKGQPYEWIATNLEHDHNAILLDEEGAATPADGVGIFVNSNLVKSVNREGMTFAVHSAVASTEKPVETENELIHNESLFSKLMDKIFNRLANKGEAPTTNQEGEDMSMKDMLKKRLGDKFQENMSEEDMLNAYDKMLKGNAAEVTNQPGEQSKPGEVVVNADVQKMINDTVQAAVVAAMVVNQQTAEAGQRTDLAAKLKANGVELSEAEQKAMSVNSLQNLVAKTSAPKTAFGLAGAQMQTNAAADDSDLPE